MLQITEIRNISLSFCRGKPVHEQLRQPRQLLRIGFYPDKLTEDFLLRTRKALRPQRVNHILEQIPVVFDLFPENRILTRGFPGRKLCEIPPA